MRGVIIMGSSRSDGDTAAIAEKIREFSDFDIIDLNLFNFSYYDYKKINSKDDYLPLMKRIIVNYDLLVFATPVYWYSMSGIMKVFFDRITDLLSSEKELGRQLRGKRMAAVSCSQSADLGIAFWFPFIESAKYLGMGYVGNFHARLNGHSIPSTELARINNFAMQLRNENINGSIVN
jgi:multimeric flavodoxin WrbA